jgi:signal transduction histidine kinase
MMMTMEKARVLVVEDDLHLLEGVKTVLEIDGYSVTTAENGHDALTALQQLHQQGNSVLPQLIVSDIMMPKMDGIDLLKAVRNEPAWVNIPFIFLTARSEKGDIQRGKQLGVDEYLLKPFDPQELLIAVEARLNRQRSMDEARMREINDVKKRILTILNHEFRTPLTFVVAYADMLAEHETRPLSQFEILNFLQGVNAGAIRLRRLIENFIVLIEFVMGEAEKNFALRRMPVVDIREIVISAQQAAQTEPGRSPIQLDIAPELPRFVADSVYLQTALVQLLDNALKFSEPENGVVVSVRHEENQIAIRVIDHGRGIPENELVRIWEPFYQVNRSMYEDPGTGSGLAIVRNVAEIHGGTASCESEVGKGSTFTLYLPVEG